jgi:hypothetical protein
MNSEDKFKNKLTNLLDEQSYSYDAENWEKASAFLDKDERKRRFLFFLFTGLGIALIVLGYFWYTSTSILPTFNMATSGSKQSTATNSNTTQPDASIVNQPTTEVLKPIKQPENSKAQKPTTTDSPVKQTEPSVDKAPLKITKPQQTNLTEKTSKTALHHITANSTPIAVPNAVRKLIPEKNPNLTSKTTTTNNDEKNNYVTEKNTDTTSEKETANTAATQNNSLNTPVNISQKVEKEEAAVNTTANLTNTPTGVNSAPQESVEPVVLAITPTVPTQLPESLPKAITQPTLTHPAKFDYFYAEVGTYFNFGWKYQNVTEVPDFNVTEGQGFNPIAGVSYLKSVSNKLSMSLGAYYLMVAHLKLGTKTSSSSKTALGLQANESALAPSYPGQGLTAYYGEQKEVTAITPLLLNYIVIPAKVHYLINSGQSITLGYSLAYLLDVTSRVETYSVNPISQSEKKTTMTGGYTEGYKIFTSQLNVGYRKKIYKNLWVDGEVLFGLTDIRDNAFFGIDLTERATGFKISLTYNLVKK